MKQTCTPFFNTSADAYAQGRAFARTGQTPNPFGEGSHLARRFDEGVVDERAAMDARPEVDLTDVDVVATIYGPDLGGSPMRCA